MRPILAFWHDDCLLHDTGSGLFEAGPSPLLAVPELHPENAERLLQRALGDRARPARRTTSRGARRRSRRDDELRDGPHRRRTSRRSTRSRDVDGVVCVEGSTFASAATPARRAPRRPARRSPPPTPRPAARRRSPTRARARPGHHAAPDTIDGYCFFNNAALAAQRLRDRGAARVAVVDWDVHHGNGTQACFWERRGRARDQRAHGPSLVGRRTTGGRARRPSAARARGSARRSTCRCRSAPATGVRRRLRRASCCRRCASSRPTRSSAPPGTDASQFDPNGRMCRVRRRASTASGPRCAGSPASSGSARSSSRRRAATPARTAPSAPSPRCSACSAAPNAIDDPLAYLPDESDAHVAAVGGGAGGLGGGRRAGAPRR